MTKRFYRISYCLLCVFQLMGCAAPHSANIELMNATESGNYELVKKSLRDNPSDGIKNSSLMDAIYRGYYDIVELLLNEGADPNYLWKVSTLGWQQAPVTETPLIHAAVYGHNRIVELLVDKGALIAYQVNNIEWYEEGTYREYARNKLSLVEDKHTVFDQLGYINPNNAQPSWYQYSKIKTGGWKKEDWDEKFPEDKFVQSDVVCAFAPKTVQNGPDALIAAINGNKSETVNLILHIAKANNQLDLILNRFSVPSGKGTGYPSETSIPEVNRPHGFRLTLEDMRVDEMEVVGRDSVDVDGVLYSAYKNSIVSGEEKFIQWNKYKFMVSNGKSYADIWFVSKDRNYVATTFCPKTYTRTQITPLMRAVFLNREEIVKLLIDAGADVTVSDSEFKTALDYAIELNHERCAELLSHANLDGSRLGAQLRTYDPDHEILAKQSGFVVSVPIGYDNAGSKASSEIKKLAVSGALSGDEINTASSGKTANEDHLKNGVGGSTDTMALLEELGRYNGMWHVKMITPKGNIRKGTVVLTDQGGTWDIDHTSRKDSCKGRLAPIVVNEASASTLVFKVLKSKALRGCRDFTADLKLINEKTLEGKSDDGRILTLTRK